MINRFEALGGLTKNHWMEWSGYPKFWSFVEWNDLATQNSEVEEKGLFFHSPEHYVWIEGKKGKQGISLMKKRKEKIQKYHCQLWLSYNTIKVCPKKYNIIRSDIGILKNFIKNVSFGWKGKLLNYTWKFLHFPFFSFLFFSFLPIFIIQTREMKSFPFHSTPIQQSKHW